MANKFPLNLNKSSDGSSSKRSSYSVLNSLNPQNIARKMSMNSQTSRYTSATQDISINLAVNPKNIAHKTLPSFMRITNPSLDFRVVSPISPISESSSTATQSRRYDSISPSNAIKPFEAPISKYYMPRKTSEPFVLRQSREDRPQSLGATLKLINVVSDPGVISSIFDPTLDGSEVLARLGKLELTRNELSSFRESQPLPRSVVDFYLKQLQITNRSLLNEKDPQDRVFIAKSSFSQIIFNSSSSSVPHSKRNLFKFE